MTLIDTIAKAAREFAPTASRINDFLIDHREEIKELAFAFQNFPEKTLPLWDKLANHGWYLNWHTPTDIFSIIDTNQSTLNEFMINHLERDFELLAKKLSSLYPKREHVLTVAFDLHRNQNYIASIPLFFSQLDGICSQNLRASYFENKEELQARVDKEKRDDPSIVYHLNLEVLKVRTQFQAGSSKASAAKKSKAPSRNGIMHGSRKHLDYGTKENSFKTFSLLCFVACCFDVGRTPIENQ